MPRHAACSGATPGDCGNLPGYPPTPESGVGCTILAASSTSFSRAAINENTPAYTCMYASTATPALDCF